MDFWRLLSTKVAQASLAVKLHPQTAKSPTLLALKLKLENLQKYVPPLPSCSPSISLTCGY